MAGSVAEERIRAKAEAMLRLEYPGARIIHELVMAQGGCRIDLAAVTPDQIVVVEIKSERDVLHRLPDQIRAATAVSRTVIIATTPKHAPKIEALGRYNIAGAACLKNPDYVRELRHCTLLVEREDGTLGPFGSRLSADRNRILNAQALLHMLWADELRAVCFDMGLGRAATRLFCISRAVELLSGQEVRRRALAQLRSRGFPRADPPVAS